MHLKESSENRLLSADPPLCNDADERWSAPRGCHIPKREASICCKVAGRTTFMKVNGSHAYQSISLQSEARSSR